MRNNFSSVCFNELLMNLATFAALVIACMQLIQGKIGLVPALTVLMLSHGFFGSIRQIQWIAHEALIGIAAAQNVEDILKINSSMETRAVTKTQCAFGGIRMEKVDFSYTTRKEVLSHVDIEIPKGRTTAIVGESGCGKSTVASMLLRFYDPKSGVITIDGQDYRSLDPEFIRSQIIMVPQQVYIFSGTVRENLQMANEQASEREIMDVLEQVRLKTWVLEQPEGMDCYVGDAGARLSGGQRQKIGIARALLTQSEYIVFDEATSSVDPESEQEIWDCLRELSEKKTMIIISHRLSTIRNADLIYVMESGRVAEYGSHTNLMCNNGLYRRLVTEQNILEQQGERRRQL
jgi:ATP-binding cassette subfamily C protein